MARAGRSSIVRGMEEQVERRQCGLERRKVGEKQVKEAQFEYWETASA